MALDTFAAKTFADDAFAGGTFTGASTGTYLQTFRANTFANRTFTGGTFQGESSMVSNQLLPLVQTITCVPTYVPNLLFDGDELVWDNVQTILYSSKRSPGPDQQYCPSGCHRHAITRKELAASDGVYTPDDLVWRIPALALPELPKPADRIEDAEGNVVTVLEVGRIVGTRRYRLVCRDLILAFQLRDSITVQRAAVSYDAAGVKLKAWAALYTGVPARVQPNTSTIVDERGVRGLMTSHNCIVGQELTVTNEDRVSFGGQFYEIRGVHNAERIDELQCLDLELVP